MDLPSSSSSPHYNNRRWQGLIYGNPQQQQQEATAAKPELMRQDASQEEEEEEESRAGPAHSIALIEKEHMFDKVVTPSDVGKLNRLVIPKQHAEKYFPLDSSTNDKGLLLNFEDRTGKPWRFRYSYWNSSQSYVMTKGWSRFVKEKKLDAGDIVSFQRGVGEHARDRLFIDWRRRPDIAPTPPPLLPGNPHAFRTISWPAAANSLLLRRPHPHPHPAIRDHTATHFMNVMSIVPPPPHPNWINSSTGIISYAPTNISGTPAHFAYGDVVNTYAYPPLPGSVVYVGSASSAIPASPHLQTQVQPHHLRQHLQSEEGGAGSAEPMVFESVPVVPSNRAPPKRLRLFGVNMDCPVPQVDPHDSAPVPVQDKQYEQATSAASSNSDDLPLQLRLYSSASNLDPATSRLP